MVGRKDSTIDSIWRMVYRSLSIASQSGRACDHELESVQRTSCCSLQKRAQRSDRMDNQYPYVFLTLYALDRVSRSRLCETAAVDRSLCWTKRSAYHHDRYCPELDFCRVWYDHLHGIYFYDESYSARSLESDAPRYLEAELCLAFCYQYGVRGNNLLSVDRQRVVCPFRVSVGKLPSSYMGGIYSETYRQYLHVSVYEIIIGWCFPAFFLSERVGWLFVTNRYKKIYKT